MVLCFGKPWRILFYDFYDFCGHLLTERTFLCIKRSKHAYLYIWGCIFLTEKKKKKPSRMTFSIKSCVYQSRGVLVGPEGLGDGPVANGHTGFRVGPYIDQLVTTMPRLYTRLLHFSWSIWTHTHTHRERKLISEINNISVNSIKCGDELQR